MAKKRSKSTKKKSGKRRRVGGVGGMNLNTPVMKLLGLAAGYFLTADLVNETIDTALTKKTTDPTTGAQVNAPISEGTKTIITGGEIGIGGLLLMKKKQSLITFAAGSVAGGAGIKRALKKFGVIKGYQSVPVIGKHRMAGYQAVPVIGVTPPQLAGGPAQLQGYKVGNGALGAGLDYGYNSQGSGVMGAMISPNANGSGLMSGTGYLG